MKKIYYLLTLVQTSPLRLTNGDNDNSDSDLMRDSRGLPFVPGSSLTGVLRTMLEKAEGDELFGFIGKGESAKQVESSVIVSDATLPANASVDAIKITTRDGVGIDDNGVAKDGAKYDFEVAETELPYTAVLEWRGEEEPQALKNLMKVVAANGISLGARTTRGYGRMSVQVVRREFAFPETLEAWLAFDPFATRAFADAQSVTGTAETEMETIIRAEFAVQGSFSVRVYTSRVADTNETGPDHTPMSNMQGRMVIPGTSWAGSFRHHMQAMLAQAGGSAEQATELDEVFGVMPDAKNSKKSGISFGETAIDGGTLFMYTRNAVDRFTQAPRNGALFTEEMCQGGKGTLEIRVQKGAMTQAQQQLLAAALVEMDLGLLTFGGGSGVGHGLATIQKLLVDGRDVTASLKQYQTDFLQAEV